MAAAAGSPPLAPAASAEGQEHFGPILFGLAVPVVAAKIGGLLLQRLGQPSVLGELLVGIGMIPRGEVGHIFTGIGASLVLRGQPVLTQGVFSVIILMVLVTTLLAPVGLRWAFRSGGQK